MKMDLVERDSLISTSFLLENHGGDDKRERGVRVTARAD